MEDILPRSCAKDIASQWLQGLQTRGIDLPHHEDQERLVLEQLRPMVKPLLDPLQFAYQPRLGVEDAIIYLLNCVYAHLDKPASTVRVMFLTSLVRSTPYVQLYWVTS